jgi:hypothetical protein
MTYLCDTCRRLKEHLASNDDIILCKRNGKTKARMEDCRDYEKPALVSHRADMLAWCDP